MSVVRCPICGEQMENSKYDNHLAWKHPETNSAFILPVTPPESKPEPVKILDEDDGSVD